MELNEAQMDRLERFTSKPDEMGRYPDDAECDAFESEMKRSASRKRLKSVS